MARLFFSLSLLILWAPALAFANEGAELERVILESISALEGCVGAEVAIESLGQAYEQVLADASWDPTAEEPRRLARRIGPALRHAFFNRRLPAATRQTALELLVQIRHAPMAEVYRTMLALDRCPPPWIALAAEGISRVGERSDGFLVASALVRHVPADGRVPRPAAWALCAATARMFPASSVPAHAADAARRLFVFAPQIAVQSCMPIVEDLTDAGALARRVLDGDDWPEAVVGDDPRVPRMLGPYGRGAALLLLGSVGGGDALDRLEVGLSDTSLQAMPTRDGAIQGLARLGGAGARRLLRDALADPLRRSPRIAHALLRLGDVPSTEVLRRASFDPDSLVEMRVSAASAYTLLAEGRPGVARRYERSLARAPELGPPFEALDARMAEMVGRLVAAERCGRDGGCWAEALSSADPQQAARAFFQLSRRARFEHDEVPLLAEVAAHTLSRTPPNEMHDLVAGAIALLARLDPPSLIPWLPVIRRARAAWEGRTNPMGLPFDIPLALGQLERRIDAD